jgi:hypothetical protein
MEIRRLRKSMDTLIAVSRVIGLKEVHFDPLRIEFVYDKSVSFNCVIYPMVIL